MQKIVLSAALLATLALAHPTKYNVDRNVTCFQPEPAHIYSYHIHLLYFQENKNHTEGAYRIHQAFKDTFNSTLGEDCDDLFHNNKSCALSPDLQPAGPFPTAQWSFFVLPEDIGAMTSWIMQHRGSYSILIHTNSGCEIEDHSDWTLWGGQSWPLDTTIFSHDEPFPWWLNDTQTVNSFWE